MADVFSKRKRSEVMSRIRSRGNRDTELALARLLRVNHITGWRRHSLVRVTVEGRKSRVEGKAFPGSRRSSLVSRLTVRPDFVFRQVRLALFVDGCFWHGCPQHATTPANNRAFWKKKLAGNKRRDALVTRTLRRAGWRVLRIWECELTRNVERILKRISNALNR
jgi:DNA mismatch endonuclease (patch repair protein)